VLLSHHFLFLQQLSLAIAAATVFLHSIIRNLVGTFNSNPLVQFLSNKSAAEPEKKKNGEAEYKPKQTQGGDELEDIQRQSQENREKRTQQGEQKQNNRKRKSKEHEGSLKTGASPSACRFVQSLCKTGLPSPASPWPASDKFFASLLLYYNSR
jgi:hypothetical protein